MFGVKVAFILKLLICAPLISCSPRACAELGWNNSFEIYKIFYTGMEINR